MKNRQTLILDRKTIEQLVDIKGAIQRVETVFRDYALGKACMPSKVYLNLKKYAGDFRAMPAYSETLKACAVKWVNVHPLNKSKGLPTVMAVVILSDPQTGFPLSIMDGTYLTNLRTGAAGAVAAKYLARRDSSVISLVGCGAQARTQLAALLAIFRITQVRLWAHQTSYVKSFIIDLLSTKKNDKSPDAVDKRGRRFIISKEKVNKEIWSRKVAFYPAKTVEDCVKGGDIVVTTTPSRQPLVQYSWLKKGAHINAIGADAKGKQELAISILKHAKVVIDDWPQASHSGEINVAVSKGLIRKKDIYADLGSIVAGRKEGRTDPDEFTVFDSTGLAIQDVAVADLIYKTALKRKKGKWVQLL